MGFSIEFKDGVEAQRAVECLSAMRGIEDPAGFRQKVVKVLCEISRLEIVGIETLKNESSSSVSLRKEIMRSLNSISEEIRSHLSPKE